MQKKKDGVKWEKGKREEEKHLGRMLAPASSKAKSREKNDIG